MGTPFAFRTTATLEEHVVDVLTQLMKTENAFKQLSAELGGVMELVGYFHTYYPGLTLERDVIERLAGIRCQWIAISTTCLTKCGIRHSRNRRQLTTAFKIDELSFTA